MRLFLSSQDLGNYAEIARKMAGQNGKAAFIRNAQDAKPPEERNFSTPLKKQMFEDAGFSFEEIDLRDYFGEKRSLQEKLEGFGSIWCAGGNVYVLRRAMKASGLDEILVDWLTQDKVLYGGWSAGAMIMTPDLKGPVWSDEDKTDIVPDGYEPNVIWDGLNLVPFYIAPHVGNEIHGEGPQQYIEYYKAQKAAYYALKDGQVVIVDGHKTEVLP